MNKPPVFKHPVFRPGVFPGGRRPRRAHPRLKGLSLNRLLPNMLTVLALCSGLTGIRFAMQEMWEQAVLSIVIAGVLDGLDGRIARLLNGASKFGAELDSLADVVSFGVAPALIIYMWSLNQAGGLGWVAVLAYAVCCALRLARFNTKLGSSEDLPPYTFNYFTGVPAPAGAGLVLLPMVLGFEIGRGSAAIPFIVVPWTLLIAGLMISALPTFSFKGMRIPPAFVVPVLVGVGLVAALLVSLPWLTLAIAGLCYLASLPFSFRQYARLKAAASVQAGGDGGAPPPSESGVEAGSEPSAGAGTGAPPRSAAGTLH
jgi:CDP-diacylglycerol--serine O-phosphatidyltransferase